MFVVSITSIMYNAPVHVLTTVMVYLIFQIKMNHNLALIPIVDHEILGSQVARSQNPFV